MSRKVGPRLNFHVVVEPAVWLSTYAETAERRCREIVASIKRHVDEVGSVAVQWDDNHTCEHCGESWTEKSHDYNGGCCQLDQDAEEQRITDNASEPPPTAAERHQRAHDERQALRSGRNGL